MEFTPNPIPAKVRGIFQNECDRMSSGTDVKLVLSHFGTFSLNFINGLTERVEEYMTSAGDDKLTIKRMFSLLIEGVNNIRKHGRYDRETEGEQIGFLILCKDQNAYHLSMANLVSRNQREGLISFIDKVNQYTKEELPSKFEEALDKEFVKHEGGAGMGFVVNRLKTVDSLHYQVAELDQELDLFVFKSTLRRLKQE